jgi:hypothetical protein
MPSAPIDIAINHAPGITPRRSARLAQQKAPEFSHALVTINFALPFVTIDSAPCNASLEFVAQVDNEPVWKCRPGPKFTPADSATPLIELLHDLQMSVSDETMQQVLKSLPRDYEMSYRVIGRVELDSILEDEESQHREVHIVNWPTATYFRVDASSVFPQLSTPTNSQESEYEPEDEQESSSESGSVCVSDDSIDEEQYFQCKPDYKEMEAQTAEEYEEYIEKVYVNSDPESDSEDEEADAVVAPVLSDALQERPLTTSPVSECQQTADDLSADFYGSLRFL